MKVVIFFESHRKLGVSEVIKEREKTYMINEIEGMKWDNRTYRSVISKGDAIYVGELLDAAVLIEKWNNARDRRTNEMNEIHEKYNKIFETLKEKFVSQNSL